MCLDEDEGVHQHFGNLECHLNPAKDSLDAHKETLESHGAAARYREFGWLFGSSCPLPALELEHVAPACIYATGTLELLSRADIEAQERSTASYFERGCLLVGGKSEFRSASPFAVQGRWRVGSVDVCSATLTPRSKTNFVSLGYYVAYIFAVMVLE